MDIWNGMSTNPFRKHSYDEEAPDHRDWKAAVDEIITTQSVVNEIINGEVAVSLALALATEAPADIPVNTVVFYVSDGKFNIKVSDSKGDLSTGSISLVAD